MRESPIAIDGQTMSGWTTEAQQRWEHIPTDNQALILDHVWCPQCDQLRRIALDGGTIIADDLVITGTCTICGHRTARLLEYEPHRLMAAESQPFHPGEPVIWLKRLPGGPYVVPLTATVVAITPKRVKIIADDDGRMITRFVPRESLQRRTRRYRILMP
jgi:hypothetical protein